MFVAWRDLRSAKGRFTLMGTVIVLITLLVGLLSGLTAGLARENVSAITGLPADRLAFAAPPSGRSVSFTDSTVTEEQWRAWAERPGVTGAAPLGIRTLNAVAGDRTAAVSAFGAEPGSGLAPGPVGAGKAVLSESAAGELGAAVGDAVRLGPWRSPSRRSPATPRTATRPWCGPPSTTGRSSGTAAPPRGSRPPSSP